MRLLLFGTFDDLHPGHRFLLGRAREKGGELFIVVARDANVRRIKRRDPVETQDVRMKRVQEAAPEATVILGDAEDFLAPVRSVRPDLILLGYDQNLPPGVQESELPCPVERLPAFEPHVHKSSLRRRR